MPFYVSGIATSLIFGLGFMSSVAIAKIYPSYLPAAYLYDPRFHIMNHLMTLKQNLYQKILIATHIKTAEDFGIPYQPRKDVIYMDELPRQTRMRTIHNYQQRKFFKTVFRLEGMRMPSKVRQLVMEDLIFALPVELKDIPTAKRAALDEESQFLKKQEKLNEYTWKKHLNIKEELKIRDRKIEASASTSASTISEVFNNEKYKMEGGNDDEDEVEIKQDTILLRALEYDALNEVEGEEEGIWGEEDEEILDYEEDEKIMMKGGEAPNRRKALWKEMDKYDREMRKVENEYADESYYIDDDDCDCDEIGFSREERFSRMDFGEFNDLLTNILPICLYDPYP